MELTHLQISEIISELASSESGFCYLMSEILNSLMKHERSLWQNDFTESSNGFRPRRWNYGTLEFSLKIPRTRQGTFIPTLLAIIRSEDDEKSRLFSLLYSKGLTTEDIGDVSELLYGRHYSKQRVSQLTSLCKSDVSAWLERKLSKRYLVVYIDATYVTTRRDKNVSSEAYYTMLGVLPDGRREVLSLVNHPTEGALNWEGELHALKARGVEQIDLIISDALSGIETAVKRSFPSAGHQFCVAHLKRTMGACVSKKDKSQLMEELKEVFPLEDKSVSSLEQYEKFLIFVRKWRKSYPTFKRFEAERNVNYFTYLDFPTRYQRMIYTTNWIERLNRSYKRTLNMRGAMPSVDAALFLMGSVAMEKTQSKYSHALAAFKVWDIEREMK